MKLINKISRYFLFSSLLIFIFIAVGLYFVIEKSITEETDEQLINTSKKIVRQIRSGRTVSFSPFVEISIVKEANKESEFKNVLIHSVEDDEAEPFRQLTSYSNINGINYKVVARISLIEKGDLLLSITIVTISTFFIFLLILYFINKTASKNILKEFKDTLNKLEKFSLKSDNQLQLSKSKIDEFEQLNRSLLFLSERAKSEYRSLKEFSEELNHEIQTPIAVIKSKLEIMLQNSNFGEDNLTELDIALKNLSKLERINKSILLLNMLDHKDLFENSDIKLSEEIKNTITTYNDFIESINLSVNLSLNDDITININQTLINSLLSNLISNAIKHNIPGGSIKIEMKNNELIISNSGQQPKGNTEKYFERFYKESGQTESVGLGLTITKKICDLYNYKIEYFFENNLHKINIFFPQAG